MANLMTLLAEDFTEITNTAAHPPLVAHRIASNFIGQDTFKSGFDPGILYFHQWPTILLEV